MKSLKLLELKALILELELIPSGIKGFEHKDRLLMGIRAVERKRSGPIAIGPRSLNTL